MVLRAYLDPNPDDPLVPEIAHRKCCTFSHVSLNGLADSLSSFQFTRPIEHVMRALQESGAESEHWRAWLWMWFTLLTSILFCQVCNVTTCQTEVEKIASRQAATRERGGGAQQKDGCLVALLNIYSQWRFWSFGFLSFSFLFLLLFFFVQGRSICFHLLFIPQWPSSYRSNLSTAICLGCLASLTSLVFIPSPWRRKQNEIGRHHSN